MRERMGKAEWREAVEVLALGIVCVEDELSGWEDINPWELEDPQDRENVRKWKRQLLASRKAIKWIMDNKLTDKEG